MNTHIDNQTTTGKKRLDRSLPVDMKTVGKAASLGREEAKKLITADGHFYIPEGVTEIRNFAFYHLVDLKNVTISEGVTEIGDNAFFRCENLREINIPSSITKIGHGVFSSTAIERIVVSEVNPTFEVRDGMLINKDENRLVRDVAAESAVYRSDASQESPDVGGNEEGNRLCRSQRDRR